MKQIKRTIALSVLALLGAATLQAQEIKHLSYAEFTKMYVGGYFINKKGCVIDFYADWCAPCRAMAPAFKKVAAEYADNYNFYKVNIDNEKQLSDFFQITSIPTLVFIPAAKNKISKKYTRHVGMVSEETLRGFVQSDL